MTGRYGIRRAARFAKETLLIERPEGEAGPAPDAKRQPDLVLPTTRSLLVSTVQLEIPTLCLFARAGISEAALVNLTRRRPVGTHNVRALLPIIGNMREGV
jgi:hypothetical protein